MRRKLLLGSCIHLAIKKTSFVFQKPLEELRVLCITTAANVYNADNKAWLYEEMRGLSSMGIRLNEYDIQGKDKNDVAFAIQDSDAVYVTGGNTYYLMEQMQKCSFKPTICSHLENGGFYIGSSAGTVVVCPTIDFIGDMDDSTVASLTDFSGLGLIDFNIMPHMDHPKYSVKARNAIEKDKSEALFLGLRDDQAVFIEDNSMQVF